jgi:hypothetical protein
MALSETESKCLNLSCNEMVPEGNGFGHLGRWDLAEVLQFQALQPIVCVVVKHGPGKLRVLKFLDLKSQLQVVQHLGVEQLDYFRGG